jgi:hypothetical protein
LVYIIAVEENQVMLLRRIHLVDIQGLQLIKNAYINAKKCTNAKKCINTKNA